MSLIGDDYNILQSIGAFGIKLGFGDKTVSEVCREQGVDAHTFLAVVNFTLNGILPPESDGKVSVQTLLNYLRASHDYYLGFQLPYIRKGLASALDSDDKLAMLILKLYDEYARSIRQHMKYEEKTVFPYVEQLLTGQTPVNYNAETYSKHHGQTDQKLRELKNIIIKYLPADGLRNHRLTNTLYDLYSNEAWLRQHAAVEDEIFVPAMRKLEAKAKNEGVSAKITDMITRNSDNPEQPSERERDVIVAMVQGMTNKEIADHLGISLNTVITHRRNIARKLQIHSPAGLTIYAIVNGLIDIDEIRK